MKLPTPSLSSSDLGDISISRSEGVEVTPADVLCGRGKQTFNHAGNGKFRAVVANVIPLYLEAPSRKVKTEIVESIVEKVRESGGRFLKKDSATGGWYVLDRRQSKEKAGHAIRDATIPEQSKQRRALRRRSMRSKIVTPEKATSSAVATPALVEPPTVMSMAAEADQANAMANAEAEEQALDFLEGEQDDIFIADNFIADIMDKGEPSAKVLSDDECCFTPQQEGLASMMRFRLPPQVQTNLQPVPCETPVSAAFDLLPNSGIEDTFKSYIDELLGPFTDIHADLADI